MIQQVNTFVVDGCLSYIADGNIVPVRGANATYEDISDQVEWRVLGFDEPPNLADGKLRANLIRSGAKYKIQISLLMGRLSYSQEGMSGWIFSVAGMYHPSPDALASRLGGIGQISMQCVNQDTTAGQYFGTCQWEMQRVVGEEVPVISLYALSGSRASKSIRINKSYPFIWFPTLEPSGEGNHLALEIEYQGY